jgi:hypothetical protein
MAMAGDREDGPETANVEADARETQWLAPSSLTTLWSAANPRRGGHPDGDVGAAASDRRNPSKGPSKMRGERGGPEVPLEVQQGPKRFAHRRTKKKKKKKKLFSL